MMAPLALESFNDALTLGTGPTSLFDADGMHEGAEADASDPAGNAGARIVCCLLTKAQ